MKAAFGADIGGTTVKLGLFSAEGTLLEKWEIPTNPENGGEAILPDTARSIRKKMAERNIAPEQVSGIGLCVPGPVDEAGVVHKCVNLGWGVFDLKARMRELLPEIPRVETGNDANVATLGELRYGGGRDFDSAVMLTLGTGVGGGVVRRHDFGIKKHRSNCSGVFYGYPSNTSLMSMRQKPASSA